MWLWEGFPELFAWKALDYAGLYDFAAAKDDHRLQSWSLNASLELLGFTFYGFDDEGRYALAFEGTDFLSGDSPRSLIEFWDVVGRGTPWEEAFPTVFGITPERFYEAFEADRLLDPNNPKNPTGPFRIELRTGPLPAWLSEGSDTVTYLFQVFGVDLELVADELPGFPVGLSPRDGGWDAWNVFPSKNLILVKILKTGGSGYEVTFTLGDGRSASTSFTHR